MKYIKSERQDKKLNEKQIKRIQDRINQGIKRNHIAKDLKISDTSLRNQLEAYAKKNI